MEPSVSKPVVRVVDVCDIDLYRQENPRSLDFIALGDAERTPAPAASFSLGTVPGELARIMMSEFDMKPPGIHIIRQGRVISDGIVLHRGYALCSASVNQPVYHVRQAVAADGWQRGDLPVRYVPGSVTLIFGPGHSVYGHWLVDFLPRFHLLAEAGCDLAKLRYLLPRELPEFALQMLSILGIPEQNLLFHDHTREQLLFDEVILPSGIRTSGRIHSIFPKATDFWLRRAGIALASAPPVERLFISRGRVGSGRTLENRARLEEIARDEGYRILEPQLLTLREQIATFQNALSVVGEYGSALHNTIFGSTALTTLALRGTSVAPGFLQTELSARLRQRLGYVWGQSEVAASEYSYTVDEGDFRLGLACLSAAEAGALASLAA